MTFDLNYLFFQISAKLTGGHIGVMLPSITVTLIMVIVTVISVLIVKKKKSKQRFDINKQENSEESQKLNYFKASDVSIKA